LRLTPASSPERVTRELTVAEHIVASGRTSEARDLLDRLLEDGVPVSVKVRARVLRSGVEHDLEAAHGELSELLEEAHDDPLLRSEVFLRHSTYLAFRDELESSEQHARQALEAAREAGDRGLEAIALARIGDRTHDLGRPEPALLARAIELADRHGTPQPFVTPRCTWAETLLRDGDLDAARDGFAAELARARKSGDEPLRGRVLVLLSDVEWRAGRWDVAERQLEEVWQLVMDAGGDIWEEGEILLRRARLAALRGQVDRTRELAEDCGAHAAVMNWPLFTGMNEWVIGFLELSVGEHARAWQALQGVTRIPTYGRPEVLEALADGVDALVALGRSSEAAVLQARLEEAAAMGHRWGVAAAQRGAAVLLLSRAEPERALSVAQEAADSFQAGGFPLDAARARIVAGDALRRRGERRRAGDQLDLALQTFESLGATLWARQAQQQLRRVRPRPSRGGDLTDAERRVAAQVATGQTNREVAAALFTSVATVEAHLTRIYAKLGIRSRTQLTRRVADGSLPLDDDADMSGFP
jgi:DNA-binding NarL/FixJ family response regulator